MSVFNHGMAKKLRALNRESPADDEVVAVVEKTLVGSPKKGYVVITKELEFLHGRPGQIPNKIGLIVQVSETDTFEHELFKVRHPNNVFAWYGPMEIEIYRGPMDDPRVQELGIFNVRG